jgi:hypothetical protein
MAGSVTMPTELIIAFPGLQTWHQTVGAPRSQPAHPEAHRNPSNYSYSLFFALALQQDRVGVSAGLRTGIVRE